MLRDWKLQNFFVYVLFVVVAHKATDLLVTQSLLIPMLSLRFRNLQASLSCYFDFVASSNQHNGLQALPSMKVVRELTIGLGESVTPNTPFTQSWLLENNGTVAWPEGCYLKLVSEINNDGKMFVPQVAPQDTHVLTISLVSPSEVGQFKSQFCLCTPTGTTFGPIIWSVVDVSLAGTLALTQQLSQLHTSQPKTNESSGCANWDEDGMDTANTLEAAPHCSSLVSASGPLSNMVRKTLMTS